MKYVKFASTLALVAGVGLASSASAGSGSGTMTFMAKVNSSGTCPLSGGPGTNQGQGDFSVDLGSIGLSDTAPGERLTMPAFSVIIGGRSCHSQIASVSFDTGSQQIDQATGALKNTLTSGAENVRLVLSDDNGPINLADASYHLDTTLSPESGVGGNTGVMNFQPSFLVVDAAATPGDFETSVAYIINYN